MMKPIKIAYIELDTHAEIAKNFYQILQNSKEIKVDFYFSPKIASWTPEIPHHLVETPEKLPKILKNNAYDWVIIGTAHRFFNLWDRIVKEYNTAIIVHNLNFAQLTPFQLLTKIFKKDWKYRLKLLIKEKLWAAPSIYKKAHKRFVLDENLSKNAFFSFLPVAFLDNQRDLSSNANEKISIAIPGNVQQARRDYGRVLDTLKHFQSAMDIIFLGKASGNELRAIESTLPFLPKNISLTYFTEKIPPQIFEKHLQNAHLLWCPIQSKTEFFSTEEWYGKTKVSGNVFDAIRSGKPVIFPKNYPTDGKISFSEQDNIEAQILHLARLSPDFSNYKKEAIQAQVEAIFCQISSSKITT